MNGSADARGDPMLTGFDQRHFEFLGNVDTYYNFLTEKHHKVGGSGSQYLHNLLCVFLPQQMLS